MVKSNFRCKAGAYYEMMKPGMVTHILITAFVGYYLAAGSRSDWVEVFWLLLGTALLAMGAFAGNQAAEKAPDSLMVRTRGRPLPTERVGRVEAWIFAGLLVISGFTALVWFNNSWTGALGLGTVVLYVAVYTPMKRFSSLNTLIGAIPGAIPPMMGWTAATGNLGMGAWVLFSILFFWQLPHFLALSWMYRKDYALGGFKMLSVTDPTGQACCNQVILNTLALMLASLLPFLLGFTGWIYPWVALVGGMVFLYGGIRLYHSKTLQAARRLFLLSLVYLPALLLAIALNRAPWLS